jgi:hypothetical protein
MSTLQKYKVKKIDLFSVTVTNSFLGKRVGNKKLQLRLSAKKYENSPSNQQKSCVCTCTYSRCGSSCHGRGSVGVLGGIAARRCSAACAPAASDSKILYTRGF